MQGVTFTHRPDNNPTIVQNKGVTVQDGVTTATMPSLGSSRRMSIVGGDYISRRRNTLLLMPLPPQDSAKVLRVISRDDLLVTMDSSVALGTGQARNMTTIGTVRYRPSKSQPKETKVGCTNTFAVLYIGLRSVK